MKKEISQKILRLLSVYYKDAKPALIFNSPFELLVAVILSAQCTDKRVNVVTQELFKNYNTPQAILSLGQPKLEKYIFSCGFYKTKSQHIISACEDIIEKFNGQVPDSIDDLKSLSGVGQKTANVVYSVAFNGNAIAVDTHVFRVSNRLGLAKGKTPLEVEKGLQKAIPENDWSKAHHWLIYHGRQVCSSQKPKCEICFLKDDCNYYSKNKKN